MATSQELSNVEWLEPWEPLSAEQARDRERELAREVKPQHPLHGATARALAARSDDVRDTLFWVNDPERFCVVHLDQLARATVDRPMFAEFESFEEFSAAYMQPDHLEFTDDDV